MSPTGTPVRERPSRKRTSNRTLVYHKTLDPKRVIINISPTTNTHLPEQSNTPTTSNSQGVNKEDIITPTTPMKTNILEASPAGTCRDHSSLKIDLGTLTLRITTITQDPEAISQGTTMVAATIIDPEKDLLIDQVAPETEHLVDTENIVLTQGTTEVMVLGKLLGRGATTATIGTTLAMEVTTEGTARRP